MLIDGYQDYQNAIHLAKCEIPEIQGCCATVSCCVLLAVKHRCSVCFGVMMGTWNLWAL